LEAASAIFHIKNSLRYFHVFVLYFLFSFFLSAQLSRLGCYKAGMGWFKNCFRLNKEILTEKIQIFSLYQALKKSWKLFKSIGFPFYRPSICCCSEEICKSLLKKSWQKNYNKKDFPVNLD
jgi:hypothetical protein